ncbi:hypothetical protein KUCAC02_023880, partial [Chaenocephalus aceratus]
TRTQSFQRAEHGDNQSATQSDGGVHPCIRAPILWDRGVAVKNGCCRLFTPTSRAPQ